MNLRERTHHRYWKYIQKGICPSCKKRKIEKNKHRCRKCLDIANHK